MKSRVASLKVVKLAKILFLICGKTKSRQTGIAAFFSLEVVKPVVIFFLFCGETKRYCVFLSLEVFKPELLLSFFFRSCQTGRNFLSFLRNVQVVRVHPG